MNVVWTAEGHEDAEEILRYLRERNPAASIKLADAFILFSDLLSRMPEIAPVWQKNSAYRMWSGIYPYKIFYTIDEREQTVFIESVYHGKRKNPDL